MATDVNLRGSQIQSALLTADLKVTGRLIDASNATLLAKVEDEIGEISCIYKPIAGERPLWDFATGTLAHREYAAYLLSSLGGFDVVPFTTLRHGPFGEGMVQHWIEVDESIDMMEFFQRDIPELRKIALFDAVVNNTDRKIGHLLPDSEGRVFGCDHGVTFHIEDKLRTVLWQWAGLQLHPVEISHLSSLQALLQGSLAQILEPLLTPDELKALDMRVDRLISNATFPVPSSDWPSVPWPPF